MKSTPDNLIGVHYGIGIHYELLFFYSSVVVVIPILFLYFSFIFVRAILCLKLNVAVVLVRGGGADVRVRVKKSNATSCCSGPRSTSNYSEPRFHRLLLIPSPRHQ